MYYTGENNFSSTLSTPNSCNTIALTPIVLLFILSWPVTVQKSLTLTIKRMNQFLTSFLWVEETQRHSSSTSPSPPPAAEPKAMQETGTHLRDAVWCLWCCCSALLLSHKGRNTFLQVYKIYKGYNAEGPGKICQTIIKMMKYLIKPSSAKKKKKSLYCERKNK